ncbi:MAG: hypothetical protein ABL994_02635, partial [Verrucomicrobiales bacterium]
AIVEAQGLDLVFDKSFLPKANKAILYTSSNVKDLTVEIVKTLNAGAPAGSAPAASPAADAPAPAAPAAPGN